MIKITKRAKGLFIGLLASILLLAFSWTAMSVYYDGFFTNVLVKGVLHVIENVTIGDDLTVTDDADVGGDLGVTGTLTVIGDAVLPTGSIGAGEITDAVYRIPVPLASVFVDGTGPITSSSAPNLTTTDNVAAIVWDNSGETAEIQFPWYPDTNFTSLTVNLICTSSGADGTEHAVDWGIWVHGNDVGLPSVIGQTGASLTSATLDASEELVTLTLDATGIAAIAAGTSGVDIAVWNNGSSNNTLEIKQMYLGETR